MFDRILEGTWKHVGTKIGSTIDANFERAIFKKGLKNTRMFHDFLSFGGRTWHQQSIKYRSNTEAQDEVPLSIDFWVDVYGFREAR